MGIVCVSSCICYVFVSVVHPVVIICSLLMLVVSIWILDQH